MYMDVFLKVQSLEIKKSLKWKKKKKKERQIAMSKRCGAAGERVE